MAEDEGTPEQIEDERRRLAEALREGLPVEPRKRKIVLRKVSDHTRRTWVSAGCFGEVVQWRLRKRKRKPPQDRPKPTEDGE